MRWPQGVTSAGVACGIKGAGALDLGLLAADEPAVWAGTFTRNAAAAASVDWDRRLLGAPVRAVVVNSGNANACTGRAGHAAVRDTAEAAAAQLGCPAEQILVASTGPIGVPLDASSIAGALPAAAAGLSPDAGSFARSILTTDTFPKASVAPAASATIAGVAKGAAMLAPNMATMLAFLVTDAACDHARLQEALAGAVDRTFNRLCLDACESTNDSVMLLATGRAGSVSDEDLTEALLRVCGDLSSKIARDAEGSTKLIRIEVAGARDEGEAVALGKAVAASDLWRAAAHGADPNWGRVLSALGYRDRGLDLDRVELAIGPEVVFAKGEPVGLLAAAAAPMRGREFTVRCVVGDGPGTATVLGADLSEEYVTLNAETTT